MRVFLDSNIVIYLIEQPAGWGPKALNRINQLLANNDEIAVSDLVRLECQVGPLASANAPLIALYQAFFAYPEILVTSLTPQVCDRAARIRAQHRYRLADALNLSSAVESGCSQFLTNDIRLAPFPDVAVEILT